MPFDSSESRSPPPLPKAFGTGEGASLRVTSACLRGGGSCLILSVMGKRKDSKASARLFASVVKIAADEDETISDEVLRASPDLGKVLETGGKARAGADEEVPIPALARMDRRAYRELPSRGHRRRKGAARVFARLKRIGKLPSSTPCIRPCQTSTRTYVMTGRYT